MASIDTGGGDSHKKGPGVKKAKKLSTRVDMTPMVDLGFLLITFFIFTATMKSPTTMDLNMPKETDQKDETKIKQSGALTIMLGKDDHVYYYEGELDDKGSNFKSTNFKEIRKIIQDKKKDVIKNHVHDDKCEEIRQKAKNRIPQDPNWQNADLDRDFVVVIKPDAEATYKNTVDILDEMTINAVKRFAMVKISETEDALIKRTEGGK
ncbi:MAG TPA: biopolymer transporter ExbD [Chitinophagaceae bacterium]|nr:biopolymer transporter ExbD [Chitinophagaceae bacterium]